MQSNFHLPANNRGPELDDFDLDPMELILSTPEWPLPLEVKIERALAQLKFRLRQIEEIPIHRIVIIKFQANDNMVSLLKSLAEIMPEVLIYHGVAFDHDSVIVTATGRRGRLVFICNEPVPGVYARR